MPTPSCVLTCCGCCTRCVDTPRLVARARFSVFILICSLSLAPEREIWSHYARTVSSLPISSLCSISEIWNDSVYSVLLGMIWSWDTLNCVYYSNHSMHYWFLANWPYRQCIRCTIRCPLHFNATWVPVAFQLSFPFIRSLLLLQDLKHALRVNENISTSSYK